MCTKRVIWVNWNQGNFWKNSLFQRTHRTNIQLCWHLLCLFDELRRTLFRWFQTVWKRDKQLQMGRFAKLWIVLQSTFSRNSIVSQQARFQVIQIRKPVQKIGIWETFRPSERALRASSLILSIYYLFLCNLWMSEFEKIAEKLIAISKKAI